MSNQNPMRWTTEHQTLLEALRSGKKIMEPMFFIQCRMACPDYEYYTCRVQENISRSGTADVSDHPYTPHLHEAFIFTETDADMRLDRLNKRYSRKKRPFIKIRAC